MSLKHALLDADGVVQNMIVWDREQLFEPEGLTIYPPKGEKYKELPPEVTMGWRLVTGKWQKPKEAPTNA